MDIVKGILYIMHMTLKIIYMKVLFQTENVNASDISTHFTSYTPGHIPNNTDH